MRETTEFVAACCRWPQNEASHARVARAAAAIVDWDDARDVVMRHRVTPLVHLAVKTLLEVPEDFRDWAKEGAQSTARHAMQMSHECFRIDQILKAEGIRPLHFKGPVLAQIAYQSIALKYSCDLDIYVAKSDAAKAVAILEGRGYHAAKQIEKMSARQIETLTRNFKDIEMIGPNGTMIELHWNFGYSYGLLSGLERDLKRQTIEVAKTAQLETFETTQMLLYLCVHGAAHHWRRLKWLADLAAFLEQLSEQERRQAIDAIRSGPARDVLDQTLKLCDRFLGTTYAPAMSRRSQALYEYARNRIDQPFIAPKQYLGDIGLLKDIYATRHIYSSKWKALRALRVFLVNKEDAMALPLPRYLNGLYPVVRLPSLLIRRLRG